MYRMRVLAIQNCEADVYADELAQVGKSKEQIVAECRDQQPEMKVLAAKLLDSFVKTIGGEQR